MSRKALLLSVLLSFFVVLPATADNYNIMLLEGTWAGKWISNAAKHDNAPMKAIIKVDPGTNIVEIVMLQEPEPPAPSFSSLSIGKFEKGKVIIDAASSGIVGGGSELTFWLEGPLILRGTYKNKYDSGIFEFKRSSGKSA